MKLTGITAILYSIIAFAGGSNNLVFAQPDSLMIDTLISTIYIKFWDMPETEFRNNLNVYIVEQETTYALAERVIEEDGAFRSEWVLSLQPPRAFGDCEYKPYIKGYEAELKEAPIIKFKENKWVAECIFSLKKTWQVVVKSDPGGVGVLNLNLQLSNFTDYTTPPMPWEEELTLEMHCVPGYRVSYSVSLKADRLFEEPNRRLEHDKDYILNRIKDELRGNLGMRALIDELGKVKVNQIVFEAKLP